MVIELASMWWALILLGVAAGIVSGTLGVGSGIVVVPAMVMLFSYPQKSAQGTALAVMVPMAFVGALRYWLNPDIELNPGPVLLIIVGALAGAFVGTEIAARLPGSTLRKLFALFLLVVGLRMLIVPGSPPPTAREKRPSVQKTAENPLSGNDTPSGNDRKGEKP